MGSKSQLWQPTRVGPAMTQIQVPAERRILPTEMIRVTTAAAKNTNAVADGQLVSLIRLPVHEGSRLSCAAGYETQRTVYCILGRDEVHRRPVHEVREPKQEE
jgi:hypothetical protein